MLRRTYDGTNTVLTVFAFGMEEHAYSYSGSGSGDTNTRNTYYYMLAGQTLGTRDGTSPGSPTNFLLTDTLGSVVSSFNNLPNGVAMVLGNQVYGPYGNQRYSKGPMGTAKGYTGQYADATGLDYYNARYYDPVVGLFVSADTVQGNEQGMDPYAYVMGNPETMVDPTGQWGWGAAAMVIGAVAGVIVVGALLTVTMPAWLPIVAGGVLAAFGVALVEGAYSGAFTSNDNFDNWGARTLLSEAIGGATSLFAYGAGNAIQAGLENANGGMVSAVGKAAKVFQTTLNVTQKANANQAGQGLGYTAAGVISDVISHQNIHAPGIGSRSKPAVHHPPAPRSISRRAPSYKNGSYSHYTAPKSNWTSSYVNSSAWQQSVWNGWLSTTSSYDPSSWITYQGQQNTHYVRDIAAARNGGF